MKNFFFIMPEYSYGGVSRTAHNLAKSVAQNGNHVVIILLRKNAQEAPYATEVHERFEKRYIFDSNVPYALLFVLSPLILTRLAWLFHLYPRGATVVSHGLLCNMLVALFKAILPGLRNTMIAFEHSVPSVQYVGRLGALKRTGLRFVIQRCDAMIGVSEGVVTDLRRALPCRAAKCHVLYNGFDLRHIEMSSKKAIGFNLDKSKFLVVSVGRVCHEKNYELLVNLAQLLRNEPIQFVVVGGGPMLESFRESASRNQLPNLKFVGEVANPYPLIGAADLFLLTSKCESFGNVLVEALALGRPIVSTDCPVGPAEILGGGLYGTLVPTGNIDAMKHAVLEQVQIKNSFNVAYAQTQRLRAEHFALSNQCKSFLVISERAQNQVT